MSGSTSATGTAGALPPGAEQVRRRLTLRYELLGCAVHGHALLERATAAGTGHGVLLWRAGDSGASFDWYRCLRCDAWVPLNEPPVSTGVERDEQGVVVVPLRGRPLRDRFVLRLIAADRIVHCLLIGAVAVAIFLFARHRADLRGDYLRILNRLQGAVGGPLSDTTHTGVLRDLDRLFAVPTSRLYLYGVAIAVYAAINGIEAVGLWGAKRWAEYLTLAEVAVLLPVEIHEVTERISVLKVLTLLINLAVIAYLLWVHRLLGIRGGGPADQAEKDRDTGWAPLERITPWLHPDQPGST